MATTTSANGLGVWLSEAYSVVSEVKSIITSPSDSTASASATASSMSAAQSGSTAVTGGSASSATSGASATNGASGTLSSTFQTSGSQTRDPSSSVTGAASSAASSASASGNSRTILTSGTSPLGQAATSSGTSPASTSAAAASNDHHNNNLPIILGSVLGGLALILLALCLFCCLRRRRSKRSKRIVTPAADEVDSWRGPDRSTQPMMADIAGPERYSYPNNPPPMSEHPAYRGVETGSTNPFVPPVPPPRKTAPNAKPGLTTDTVPGQEPYTASSPSRPNRRDPLAAGLAGLASAAAARKVARKPIHNGSPAIQTSDLPEPVSPINESPRFHSGYGYNHPSTRAENNPGGYDQRPSYSHFRSPSHQPLMSGGDVADRNPTSYTEDRPPTPFGLMGMGAAGAGAGLGVAASHHLDSSSSSSHSHPHHSSAESSSRSRQSYDSATMYPAAMRPAPSHYPSRHQTPPYAQNRSPRRAHFGDPVELPSPTVSSNHRSSSQSGSSGSNIPRHTDTAYPTVPTHHTPPDSHSSSSNNDSGDSAWRLSSSMPGGWGPSTTHHQPPSPGLSSTSSPLQSNPTGKKRLRLSDLRAQEEELDRLKEHEGWDDQQAYGRGSDGYGRRGSGSGTGFGIGTAL